MVNSSGKGVKTLFLDGEGDKAGASKAYGFDFNAANI
jgi:hypothetical protein